MNAMSKDFRSIGWYIILNIAFAIVLEILFTGRAFAQEQSPIVVYLTTDGQTIALEEGTGRLSVLFDSGAEFVDMDEARTGNIIYSTPTAESPLLTYHVAHLNYDTFEFVELAEFDLGKFVFSQAELANSNEEVVLVRSEE